jgi:hypothetical protein
MGKSIYKRIPLTSICFFVNKQTNDKLPFLYNEQTLKHIKEKRLGSGFSLETAVYIYIYIYVHVNVYVFIYGKRQTSVCLQQTETEKASLFSLVGKR